jgi:hypothetical protein
VIVSELVWREVVHVLTGPEVAQGALDHPLVMEKRFPVPRHASHGISHATAQRRRERYHGRDGPQRPRSALHAMRKKKRLVRRRSEPGRNFFPGRLIGLKKLLTIAQDIGRAQIFQSWSMRHGKPTL